MTYFDGNQNINTDLYFEIQSLKKSLYKFILTLKKQQAEYEEKQRKLEYQLNEVSSTVNSYITPEKSFKNDTDNKNSSKVEIGDVGNKISVSIDISPLISLILLLVEKNSILNTEDFNELVSKLKKFNPNN